MAGLKDIGMGKGRESEITQEQEQGKVFEMLSHGEGWWHAVKTNPKALLWCEYQSIRDTCASIIDVDLQALTRCSAVLCGVMMALQALFVPLLSSLASLLILSDRPRCLEVPGGLWGVCICQGQERV